MRRTVATAVLSLVAVVLLAAPASAKSFSTPRAEVDVEVQPDGSLLVQEHITFDYNGSFTGAYRDIPLVPGQSITDVQVSEGDVQYTAGASAELGSSGTPGTFGIAESGNLERIVWHYQAANEQRTFTISYRFLGLAHAYDDVVDVDLQVWGDHWKGDLTSLQATMRLPGQSSDVRVWGHPVSVNGSTALGSDGASATLRASDVPPEQFVEMRVVFPRSLPRIRAGAPIG